MSTVVLVIHLMIAIALVGVVLLQRSEGGALGIGGGGGGGGGFMSGRGTANLLTRMTAGLAAAFFVTSIVLTILARQSVAPRSILDGAGQQQEQTAPADGESQSEGGGILDRLREQQPGTPQVPRSQ